MVEQLLLKEIEASFPEMVKIRRYLHQHPELSFKEYKTAEYICQFYKERGISYRNHVGGNGVVAKIIGDQPGPTVALRADFDALPIQDEKDGPYRSTIDGVMHACGHDGHTATLLMVADVLFKHKEHVKGTVVFIHQHAEEYAPGGAISMIEDGCLDGVDVIFGTHLWAVAPLGEILYRSGPFMAAADRFEITIHGKGGHGAQPQNTKDSIAIASQFVCNLQQLVSRRIDPIQPAVVTVGSIHGGEAFNVIADKTTVIGTARSFDEGVRDQLEHEIGRILAGTCMAADVTYTYDYVRGYPAVVNHEEETLYVVNIASDIEEVKDVKEYDLQMGGEDFAYYLQYVKGTFFFTGAQSPETTTPYPHHHPKFDFDERAMLIAAKTLLLATVNYSKE
ncbi:MAG: amidohydrolase [Bacillaceae bacterium]